MLRKLIKYEWRSIYRLMLPLCGAVLVMSLVNKVLFDASMTRLLDSDLFGPLPRIIAMLVYVALVVALGVLTLIFIVQRFYKGLLSEEGYLMFTLPVKPWELIASKGIVAAVLSVISGVTAMLSIMLLSLDREVWSTMLSGLREGIRFMSEEYPLWPLLLLEGLVLLVASLAQQITNIYAAIAMGHLSKHARIPLSILAYIGLSVVQSTVTWAAIMIIDSQELDYYLSNLIENIPLLAHVTMGGMILYTAFWSAAFFGVTNLVLSRYLNLE